MIAVDINWQLMRRQPAADIFRRAIGYKLDMQTNEKRQRTASTPTGARILEEIGDDSYEEAAARIQQHGGRVSAPALHKWVTGSGEITEPNIRAFCDAYRISPAWLRYGVGERKADANPQSGLVESLPKDVRAEAVDFIGYLVERKQPLMAREQVGRYMTMIDRIKRDMDEKRNGQ